MVTAQPSPREELTLREDLAFLRGVRLFSLLPDAALHDVAASVRKRNYRRGEVIHHADDLAGDVFVIVQGHVKHRLTAPDGRQITHRVHGPGDCYGLLSVLDRKRRAGDAVALTDCEVLVVDRDVVAGLLMQHPETHAFLLDLHVGSVRHKLALIQDLAFLSVPARLAKVLLYYGAGGEEPGGAGATMPSYLNQTELAFLVGTTRESVNLSLKSFAQRGWIIADRREVRILDPDGLRRLIE